MNIKAINVCIIVCCCVSYLYCHEYDIKSSHIESNRATLLSEGFESTLFPPNEWQTTGWTRNVSGSYLITGAASAICRKNINSNGQRLLTPKVRVNLNSTLSFKTKHSQNGFGEQLKIRYSTNNTTWSNLQTVTLTSEPVQHTINLGTLSPGDYYLCFETYSVNTSEIYKTYVIDEVLGPYLVSSIGYGNLVCVIRDIQTHSPIVGARVIIDDREVVSGLGGVAEIDSLLGGEYTLQCLANGYQDYNTSVIITANGSFELNINLCPNALLPICPNITMFERNSLGYALFWEALPNASLYHVYGSCLPDSGFVLIANTVECEFMVMDSALVTVGIDGGKAFFRVTGEMDE